MRWFGPSALDVSGSKTWGVAPGWYGVAPLALKIPPRPQVQLGNEDAWGAKREAGTVDSLRSIAGERFTNRRFEDKCVPNQEIGNERTRGGLDRDTGFQPVPMQSARHPHNRLEACIAFTSHRTFPGFHGGRMA